MGSQEECLKLKNVHTYWPRCKKELRVLMYQKEGWVTKGRVMRHDPGEWAGAPGTGWTQDLWRLPALRGRQRKRMKAGGKKLATVTGAF